MSDWALNNGVGYDVKFVRNARGKLDRTLVRGAEAVAQRVQMRCRTFFGECRYNRGLGLPWSQVLFAKGTTDQAFVSILTTYIGSTKGVRQVLSLEIARDRLTRKASGICRAQIETPGALQELEIPVEVRA